MRFFPLQLILLLFATGLFAQTESMSRRDDRYLREVAIPDLLNSYEITLNVITAGEAFPNEIKNHIDRILGGDPNERIFVDDQVRIENDLIPGADTMATKEDKIVRDYLEDLIALYPNPQANSIVFDKDYKISNLKKTTFFYYNAIFNSTFKGTNIDNKSYHTVGRVAEIKLQNDSGQWYASINGIRFYDPLTYDPLTDTTNLFQDYNAALGDSESYVDYLSKLNAEKSKYFEERDREIRTLLESAKRSQEKGDLYAADSLLSQAWTINPSDRMVLVARTELKAEKERVEQENLERKRREEYIARLKRKALTAYSIFDFNDSRKLLDTLNYKYDQKSDEDLQKLGRDLGLISTTFDPSSNDIAQQRYKDAIKYCDGIMKKNDNPVLASEASYQKALAYLQYDSAGNVSRIMEGLDDAIVKSDKKHAPALSLRALMKANQKKYDEAIGDATYLVDLDNANPGMYAKRAAIFEAVNRNDDAMADYVTAIKLSTTDPMVYASKARLELADGKVDPAIATTTTAIDSGLINAEVYFQRALAEIKSGDMAAAGSDYSMAKRLDLNPGSRKSYEGIVEGYHKRGKESVDKGLPQDGLKDLRNAVTLDTSSTNLYWLGLAYEKANMADSAEMSFTLLIDLFPDTKGAYFERGISRRMQKNYEGAISDFSTEYTRTNSKEAVLEKVVTQIKTGKFADAATEAEQAARKFNDAMAYSLAIEAYYRNKQLDKTMEVFETADKNRLVNSRANYYIGRTWYDKGEMKKARQGFEDALEMDMANLEAAYWMGFIQKENEKYEEALTMLEKAFNSEEYKYDAFFTAAFCRIKLGETSNIRLAEENLDKVMKAGPERFKNAETLSWMAYCKSKLGNDKEASKLLAEAGELDSTDVVFHFVSACLSSKMNDMNAAIDHFEKALRQDSKITKSDVEDESYLDGLRNSPDTKDRYKKIMKLRF